MRMLIVLTFAVLATSCTAGPIAGMSDAVMEQLEDFIHENFPCELKFKLQMLAEKVGKDKLETFFGLVKQACIQKKETGECSEELKAQIEAAKDAVTQGCPEAGKLLKMACKVKFGLAMIFKVNMEMMAGLNTVEKAMFHGVMETLGEDAAKCLCKLRVQEILTHCALNCIESKLDDDQREFLDELCDEQKKIISAIRESLDVE